MENAYFKLFFVYLLFNVLDKSNFTRLEILVTK